MNGCDHYNYQQLNCAREFDPLKWEILSEHHWQFIGVHNSIGDAIWAMLEVCSSIVTGSLLLTRINKIEAHQPSNDPNNGCGWT